MENGFNAQHAPVGAFASFTLGKPGPFGGFGLELGKPADQHIYIGAQDGERDGVFQALPFFGEEDSAQEDFVLEEQGDVLPEAVLETVPIPEIKRTYRPASDCWEAGDLSFTLYSPIWPIPEPKDADEEVLKKVLIPAVFGELRLDNRRGERDRRVFFGYQPDNLHDHIRENWNLREQGVCSLCNGRSFGVATSQEGSETGLHFDIKTLLGEPNRERFHFGNATTGMIDWIVPAGEVLSVPLVFGFFREGVVTSGLECRYFYHRFYHSLDEVLLSGLENFEIYKAAALAQYETWDADHLSELQRFHLSHSIHSYYGSTQLLDHAGEAFWVINEGEYRMMNTLDLTADQLFFELKQNPWTTRNVLENYLKFYSYEDRVRFPGDVETHPGGLSFCHDMGVMNGFTRPGTSCYEVSGLKGCFSFMTHEELVNWAACALAYVQATGDEAWKQAMVPTFHRCLTSLCQRDYPDPAFRNGIMKLDSDRTQGGGEITTYDSLDVSLGQSRTNT